MNLKKKFSDNSLESHPDPEIKKVIAQAVARRAIEKAAAQTFEENVQIEIIKFLNKPGRKTFLPQAETSRKVFQHKIRKKIEEPTIIKKRKNQKSKNR